MKKVFFVLLVCLTSFQAFSQTKLEKINKFISIVNSEETTNKMFDNMLQVMKQQDTNLSKAQQDELSEFMISETKALLKKSINEYYPNIYDKYLTEKDIDELIKFYQSPTGEKYLKIAPNIQMELMQNYLNADLMAMQKKIDQKRMELKER